MSRNKLLDIYITHWTEPYDVGKKMFDMLSLQRNVDWSKIGVNLIHDGSGAFPDSFFKDCPFMVNQICLPHGGISAARNYAIKNSDATWIKFCDFDDMFAGVYSLSCIMDVLNDTDKFDMLWYPLVIEMSDGTTRIIECSPVFIHDKVYRVSFLREHNLFFNESLTFSEDFAFIAVTKLFMDMKRIGRINCNFHIYLYTQRGYSIGNREDMWYKNRCSLFDAHAYVEQEERKHGNRHDADILAVRTVYENYVTMLKAGDRYNTSALKQKTFEYYDQHKDSFDRVTDKDIDAILDATNCQNGIEVNKQNLLNWIESRGNKIYESNT